MKFDILIFKENLLRKFVSLKSDKNHGCSSCRRFLIYEYISLDSSDNETFVNKICRENQNKHLMSSNFFFLKIVLFMR